MFRILCTFPFFLSGALFAASSLYTDSQYWPPRVELTETLEIGPERKALPKGRGGILIRVELDDQGSPLLLVDFGSNGLHRLVAEQTDILQRISDLKNGAMTKQCPNWTMMIGRGFVRTNGGTFQELRLDELYRYEQMLIIYDDTLSDASLGGILGELKKAEAAIKAQETLVVIIPVGDNESTSSKGLLELTHQHDLQLYYMYPYLSNAFLKSLAHLTEDTEFPCSVLVDVEGKTLIAPEHAVNTVDRFLSYIEKPLLKN